MVLLAAIVAFIASAQQADFVPLPGVALGSSFLLDMERAAVAAALVVGAAVFLTRGWAGYFPSKLTTTGAEYAARSSVEGTANVGDEAIGALAEVKSDNVMLASSMYDDLRGLELKVDALARELRGARLPLSTDDML